LTILNIKYGHRILDILKVQVDKNANVTESYTNIVTTTGLNPGDNGYNGEYAFPTDLLRPLRAEISVNGTFVKCDVYDLADNDLSETPGEESGFSINRPFVRFERDSYFVRPVPTSSVTSGLHIWYEARQTALSALSETPTFEQNLHDILAFDIAEVEALKHTENFSVEWRNAFAIMKAECERRFFDYYKNFAKRNLKMIAKKQNYK